MRRPDLWQQYLDRIMPQEEDCWWTQSDESKVTHKQQDYFEALLPNGYRHRRNPALWQCYCEVNKGQEKVSGQT